MSKPKLKEKAYSIVVNGVKITPFEGCGFELPINDLPPGVQSLSVTQIKFENPGEHIWGRYVGAEQCKARKEDQKDYLFHMIELENGAIAGFIGCVQLDKSLAMIANSVTDVHVIYMGKKDLVGGQTLRTYQLFKRAHVFEESISTFENLLDSQDKKEPAV